MFYDSCYCTYIRIHIHLCHALNYKNQQLCEFTEYEVKSTRYTVSMSESLFDDVAWIQRSQLNKMNNLYSRRYSNIACCFGAIYTVPCFLILQELKMWRKKLSWVFRRGKIWVNIKQIATKMKPVGIEYIYLKHHHIQNLPESARASLRNKRSKLCSGGT